jgi:ribosomal protein S27E
MDAVQDAAADRLHGGSPYVRHRPEDTLLYQVIDDTYPDFIDRLEAQGRTLPKYVRREFEDYLKCGRLEHGFLRVRCTDCRAEKFVAFSCKRRGFCPSCGARRMVESAALLVDEVLPRVPLRQWVLSVPYPLRFLFATNPAALGEALSLVYRALSGFMLRKAKLTRAQGQCGAVTLIQRFGSALNLNVHFHMLIPDGVYLSNTEVPYFKRLSAPSREEIQALVEQIGERIGRHLERKGLLMRDAQSSQLSFEPKGEDAEGLADLQSHSISYRIALGAQRGRKAFTLRSLPPSTASSSERVAQAAGFSLHAGVAAEADERDKLERLCRYISRPAVATERLSRTSDGRVRYTLKTPYRDGTTHVMFEPLDFLARLAALVPSPGVNLTRYHGVFAPNHRMRAQIVPSRRGRDARGECRREEGGGPISPHVSMGWAKRLKRVFGIEIERCDRCGGTVKIIASIEDPEVIAAILEHVGFHESESGIRRSPPARGPPRAGSDSLPWT